MKKGNEGKGRTLIRNGIAAVCFCKFLGGYLE
jgi:hypothetical protein